MKAANMKTILHLKRVINDVTRDRAYTKDSNLRLVELLCSVDDLLDEIDVDVLQVNFRIIIEKTGIYKALRPILSFGDSHKEIKEVCNRMLTDIFNKVKAELFEDQEAFDKLQDAPSWKKEFTDLLDHLARQNHDAIKLNEKDISTIKTDQKYLTSIKRQELNMLIDSKRGDKAKIRRERLSSRDESEQCHDEQEFLEKKRIRAEGSGTAAENADKYIDCSDNGLPGKDLSPKDKYSNVL